MEVEYVFVMMMNHAAGDALAVKKARESKFTGKTKCSSATRLRFSHLEMSTYMCDDAEVWRQGGGGGEGKKRI